jgi:hypothetical protein
VNDRGSVSAKELTAADGSGMANGGGAERGVVKECRGGGGGAIEMLTRKGHVPESTVNKGTLIRHVLGRFLRQLGLSRTYVIERTKGEGHLRPLTNTGHMPESTINYSLLVQYVVSRSTRQPILFN